MRTSRSGGFTLIEMLVTLAIFAILLMIAIPSMRPFLQSQSIKNASMDISSTVALARNEAIKRNATVDVNANNASDWSQGWVVSQTTTATPVTTYVIRKQPALGNIVIVPSGGSFSFDGNGRMTSTGSTFTIKPLNIAGSQPLCLSVRVGSTGSVESTRVTCT